MKIAVTGASGLIGTALVPALRADGHEVVRFVRGPAQAVDERRWDPASRRVEPAAVADLDAVVHLAGVGVADSRWTPTYKANILASRVDGTTAIARAVAQAGGPGVLLSASAIGWYGETGEVLTDESGPMGQGFLADVCQQWEQATMPAQDAGVRVVHLRTGIVLASQGGALPRLQKIYKVGLGAPLGSGHQWMSWISLQDEVAAIVHCLSAQVAGPVNLVGPSPVTNRVFTKALGAAVHRPTLPVPVPGFVLQALLGDFAQEGLLTGQRLAPAALEGSDFVFTHRELASALQANL